MHLFLLCNDVSCSWRLLPSPLSSCLQVATQTFWHFFAGFAFPSLLLLSWLSAIGPYFSWTVLIEVELILQREPHECWDAQKTIENFLFLSDLSNHFFRFLVCHGRCVVLYWIVLGIKGRIHRDPEGFSKKYAELLFQAFNFLLSQK